MQRNFVGNISEMLEPQDPGVQITEAGQRDMLIMFTVFMKRESYENFP